MEAAVVAVVITERATDGQAVPRRILSLGRVGNP